MTTRQQIGALPMEDMERDGDKSGRRSKIGDTSTKQDGTVHNAAVLVVLFTLSQKV